MLGDTPNPVSSRGEAVRSTRATTSCKEVFEGAKEHGKGAGAWHSEDSELRATLLTFPRNGPL